MTSALLSATGGDSGRFVVLDGVRGVAALSVMVFHFTQWTVSPLLHQAGLSVDLFFVLSGFVISHAYGRRVRAGPLLARFMLLRVIRLWPMYLVGCAIGVPVFAVFTASGHANYPALSVAEAAVANTMFLPFVNSFNTYESGFTGAVNGITFPINNPGWSLFYELLVNVFFFKLFGVSRRLLLAVIAVGFCGLILTGLTLKGSYGISLIAQPGWGSDTMVGGLFRVFYGFSAGVFIYRFLVRPTQPAADRWLAPLKAVARSRFAIPLIAVVMTMCFTFPYSLAGFYYVAAVLVLPLVVIVGAQVRCGRSVASVCRYLGEISYPLYCIHYPIGRGIELLGEAVGQGGAPTQGTAVLSGIVSIGLATALARWVDVPARGVMTEFVFSRLGRQSG
jgi:peptidoglycan/LPS O-acetylase OafA/YrhL